MCFCTTLYGTTEYIRHRTNNLNYSIYFIIFPSLSSKMNIQSPQQSVFTISEIVENILSQADLTPLSLLCLRLVNKTCNLVILSARPFRRALFLDPGSPSSTNDPSAIEINPLLEKTFPLFMQKHFSRLRTRRSNPGRFAPGYFDFAASADVIDSCYAHDALLPHVVRSEKCKGGDFRWTCFRGPCEGCCLHLPLVGSGAEEMKEKGKEGLWRNMYATRPAVPIHVVNLDACGWQEHKWEIQAGTQMGEVMDLLVAGVVVRGRGPK